MIVKNHAVTISPIAFLRPGIIQIMASACSNDASIQVSQLLAEGTVRES